MLLMTLSYHFGIIFYTPRVAYCKHLWLCACGLLTAHRTCLLYTQGKLVVPESNGPWEQPSTNDWWELVDRCPSFLVPEVGWLWGVSSVVSRAPEWHWTPDVHNGKDYASFTSCLPFSISLPHWSTGVSWDHPSKELFALEPLSQGLPLGDPKPRHMEGYHQNMISDFSLDWATMCDFYFLPLHMHILLSFYNKWKNYCDKVYITKFIILTMLKCTDQWH